MNETPDPLEAELSALSPHDVSPGLRGRIAERLSEPSSVKLPRWQWRRLALTGGLAAACLAAVVYLWGGGGVNLQRAVVGPPNVPPVEPAPRFRPMTPAIIVDWEPRLVTYQRALARSPEDLDVLLSHETRLASEPHSQLVQFRAFTPSNASLNALLGDD